MKLFDLLEKKYLSEQMQETRIRIYNDIACILWYFILYDDILKHKREQMDSQQQAFRTYTWGNRTMMFGAVAALNSAEDITKFEKRAAAVLKDKGYGKFTVKAYPDAIVLSNI